MSFLTRNPKNQLRSVVFTDGTVKSVASAANEVRMAFADYCGATVEITFLGVSRMLLGDRIDGAEIMNASLRWTGGSWVARFEDDDGETILELTYTSADAEQRRR